MDDGSISGVGEEHRRFPRYRITLPVRLKYKRSTSEMLTSEVSRHGIFVRTDDPSPMRQLIQPALEVRLSRCQPFRGAGT